MEGSQVACITQNQKASCKRENNVQNLALL